ncbi:valyl-tRNA synthetase [Burkholderia sp. LS-044]|nr:valyl-tRNA synthetase [Burkholderia territorii]THJ52430.1 valyl-tRNA synthetase [Burkholderia sp. LS-044]
MFGVQIGEQVGHGAAANGRGKCGPDIIRRPDDAVPDPFDRPSRVRCRHVAAASRRARAGKAMAGRCASIYNCRIRHPIHAFFGRFPT